MKTSKRKLSILTLLCIPGLLMVLIPVYMDFTPLSKSIYLMIAFAMCFVGGFSFDKLIKKK